MRSPNRSCVKGPAIEFQRLPRRPSVCPNATVVPSSLVMLNLFQDEVVQFDHVCVLFKRHQLAVQLERTNVR
jgi:hypothetical protein